MNHRDRCSHDLERARGSYLHDVDGVGQAKAFSLRLVAVRNAPNMVDPTK